MTLSSLLNEMQILHDRLTELHNRLCIVNNRILGTPSPTDPGKEETSIPMGFLPELECANDALRACVNELYYEVERCESIIEPDKVSSVGVGM